MIFALLVGCVPEDPKPAEDSPAPACTPVAWFADVDEDGFGAEETSACEAPTGHVAVNGDCNDRDPAIHPDAAEVCDGVDQDCDLAVDEDLPTVDAWRDADGDGFGDPTTTTAFCAVPEGWLENAEDCDDTDPAVSPTGLERCNGYDDDCDALVDDDDSPIYGVTTWWWDGDGDGFGEPDQSWAGCAAPAGYVVDGGDCDDVDGAINPASAEICLDLVDQDCDGLTDDYSGECAPKAPEDGTDTDCDTTSVAVGMAACTAGVAAVLPSGATFGAVQDAIDAAATGDVVSVCPGTWTETLSVNVSPLVLIGYGSGVSVLEGAGSGVVDMGTGNELTLLELGIESGSAYNGGGLQGVDATLCVEDTDFSLNAAESEGGAVYLAGSGTAAFARVLFYGNMAVSGGGLRVTSQYTLTIDASSFLQNEAGHAAGGAAIDSTSTVTIRTTDFLENMAGYSGGGVVYDGSGPASTLDLEDVSFVGNRAGYEGGALAIGSWDYPFVTAVECLFEDNVADYEGGGVSMGSWGGGTFYGVRSEFRGNAAPSGGAINLHAWGTPAALLADCTLDGNTAGGHGAAISLNPVGSGTAEITLIDSFVTTNTAGSSDGAAQVDPSAAATLTSTNTDWGTGATENLPDDIGAYTFGAAETFVCNAGVCL